jgi:hypothetical protein
MQKEDGSEATFMMAAYTLSLLQAELSNLWKQGSITR